MSSRNIDGKIASQSEAAVQTQLALEELMGISDDSHNFKYETMLVEKDGKMIEVEVPIDDIDLLDDFDDEDLTEEGQRSLGMIDKDHDSTSQDQSSSRTRNKLQIVKVKYGENMEIVCPFTGSKDVYQIDSEKWASYETDQPFLVMIVEEED